MKFKYITIEREYGSGGTVIARRLAEECGISCYGQEILEAVAKEQNVSVEDIQRSEENVSNSFLYTVYAIGQVQVGNSSILSPEGKLFVAEHEFIRKSAYNGPAVYLGHCASEALKNFKILKVFIRCQDREKKAKRVAEEYNIPDNEIERTCKRFDNKRSRYYHANTMKKWEDMNNYDVVLDSGVLGVDGCVAALKALIQK